MNNLERQLPNLLLQKSRPIPSTPLSPKSIKRLLAISSMSSLGKRRLMEIEDSSSNIPSLSIQSKPPSPVQSRSPNLLPLMKQRSSLIMPRCSSQSGSISISQVGSMKQLPHQRSNLLFNIPSRDLNVPKIQT
jgi:hypothetical protein